MAADIDYKLALALRDAGFPQKNLIKAIREGKSAGIGEYAPYKPTLSELVESCIGEYWFTLAELKPHAWRAEGKTLDLNTLKGEGKTPSEAVANLYIALHGEHKKPNKESI